MTTPSPHDILASIRSVAVVGFSANPERASHYVAAFLAERGYECIGVNPGLAGQTIAGIPVVGSLADLPAPVDMVDIFRGSEHAGAVVDEALALTPRPSVIWMQLGVTDDAAKARAEAAGLAVVMDNCPKMVLGGT